MHPSCSLSSDAAFVSTQTRHVVTQANEHATVYIFVGGIIFAENWWRYTLGGIIVLIGIGYVALEYVPSIEPPANMR
jgi:hypothetical protein